MMLQRMSMIVTLVLASSAAAQTALADSPVGDAVEQIRSGLESTINTGSARLNGNVIFAQGAATALLNQLDLIAAARQGQLVRDLSLAERNLFAEADSLMRSGQAWTATTADQMNTLVRNASNLITLLPGGKSTPILQGISPTFVARTSTDAESFDVTFKGINIGLSTPLMALDSRSCRPKTVTNNEVTFDCPLEGTVDKPTVLEGEVSFFKTVSLWDKLKDFVFRSPPKLQNYVTRITVLPAALGTVDAVMVVPESRTERQVIADSRSDQNGHCAGERRTDFLFVAPTGWKLDPSMTPEVSPDTREASTYIGLTGRTDTQFTLSGTVKNSGQCVKVKIPFAGPQTIAYDARGRVSVGVRYTVIKDVVEDKEVSLPGQPLQWGKDVTIKFPADSKQMRVTVTQLNGISKTTDRSETIGWVEVLMDNASHTAILRPLTPDKALRQ
ncbi:MULTISPECIES: hypothetical protein [Deinococcus]|uniref:Uncharacterized protein n=1 Tax=Deinococcus rufus TaxID=2136097 RepID=A0ABV7Z9F0_9DEIO|nr:hypothetical protein [Deinococcus sp. AB2017081]WQE94650.1 hypothetical protein U2P90_14740 [Deinococcus sp. AB2017081]